mmetsp:Transcript_2981/g.5699  ORF Transcript_2981/g.5699 Transcript_2981/m.5699 type:complete len:396 (-) Transcript_2981:276-1463(-)
MSQDYNHYGTRGLPSLDFELQMENRQGNIQQVTQADHGSLSESDQFKRAMRQAIETLLLVMNRDGWVVEEIRATSSSRASLDGGPESRRIIPFPKLEISGINAVTPLPLSNVESFCRAAILTGRYSVDAMKFRYAPHRTEYSLISSCLPHITCLSVEQKEMSHDSFREIPVELHSSCTRERSKAEGSGKSLLEEDHTVEKKRTLQSSEDSSQRFWKTVMELDPTQSTECKEEVSQELFCEVGRDDGKSFRCERCASRFKRKRNLSEHIALVHEKLRPFVCLTCKLSFGKRSNLSKHVRIVHEKQRPFSCEICGASFGQRSHVQSHVRTVHNREKPFHCSECSLSFGQKSALNAHVRALHHKEKSFSCDECGVVFGQKGDLTRHRKVVHLCLDAVV